MKLLLRPFFWFSRTRRWWLDNNTSGSTTLLLGIIASANVIWGYPLGTLFASFIVLLLVAAVINRLFYPQFDAEFEGSSLVRCGNTFSMVCKLRNTRPFTLYDLIIDVESVSPHLQLDWVPVRIDAFAASSTIQFTVTAKCTCRGVYDRPTVHITTSFPFGIFRTKRTVRPSGFLDITPIPFIHSSFNDIGDSGDAANSSAKKHSLGETFEYVGSREWFPTAPLVRWDFAAWCRLGKPVVREYESITSLNVVIWVDVSTSAASTQSSFRLREPGRVQTSGEIEAVYSLTAGLLNVFESKRATIRLFLSCEDKFANAKTYTREHHPRDRQKRLAAGGMNNRAASCASLEELSGNLAETDLVLLVSSTSAWRTDYILKEAALLASRFSVHGLCIDENFNIETELFSAHRRLRFTKVGELNSSEDAVDPV